MMRLTYAVTSQSVSLVLLEKLALAKRQYSAKQLTRLLIEDTRLPQEHPRVVLPPEYASIQEYGRRLFTGSLGGVLLTRTIPRTKVCLPETRPIPSRQT